MRNQMRLMARVGAAVTALALTTVGGMSPLWASNTCLTGVNGHVYYVAYQNNPPGAEYIVDLGDRTQFLNATTKLTFPDIRAADFATLFTGAAPNLWIGFFGVRNPATRDAIVSANGPLNAFQLSSSSTIGAAQQIDSWSTGFAQFSNGIGGPCSPNAGSFPGRVFGSYQDTLNGLAQGSISTNVAWNVETRLSDGAGVRTAPPNVRFFSAFNNPSTGQSSRGPIGYFVIFTNGTAEYYPDFDGDLLPDVDPASDPNA